MLKTENLLLKHCNKIFFKSQNTLFTRFWCWLIMNSAIGPAKKTKTKGKRRLPLFPNRAWLVIKQSESQTVQIFTSIGKFKLQKLASRKRKAWIHTIIHKPQQVWRKKKKRAWLARKQSQNTNSSNFPKPSTSIGLKSLYSYNIKNHNRSTQYRFCKMKKKKRKCKPHNMDNSNYAIQTNQ